MVSSMLQEDLEQVYVLGVAHNRVWLVRYLVERGFNYKENLYSDTLECVKCRNTEMLLYLISLADDPEVVCRELLNLFQVILDHSSVVYLQEVLKEVVYEK